MNNKVFLFDLDSTITQKEILPALAEEVGMLNEIQEITEKTMRGEIPFKSSFFSRVNILKTIPVSRVSEIVARTPLNNRIVSFIQEHKDQCYIVTGNIDVWIEKLIEIIGIPMTHVFCSTAVVENDRLVRINSVADKESIVKQFVLPVVAIGDGSNDAEMIRLADIGIGFGGVRPVANSVLENCTHAIYDECRLCDFLCILNGETEKESKNDVSIVISCAGMGTRLGLGCTKALVEIEGQTLIERHLSILKEYDDIRIVVGYQAQNVIDQVNHFRKDILFVFNHDYRNTGTGASFTLGTRFGRRYALALDGDLLVHPDDLIAAIEFNGSCVGGTTPGSDNPWLMPIETIRGIKNVIGFNQEYGDYEWTGLAKLAVDKLRPGKRHVFHLIEPLLPMPMVFLRTKEIDTIDDYERAVKWVRNGYED